MPQLWKHSNVWHSGGHVENARNETTSPSSVVAKPAIHTLEEGDKPEEDIEFFPLQLSIHCLDNSQLCHTVVRVWGLCLLSSGHGSTMQCPDNLHLQRGNG